MQPDLFFGYERIMVDSDQFAYVATPEKALLDLIYLQPGGDDPGYLASLRLQNLDRLDLQQLLRLAQRTAKPKLLAAVNNLQEFILTGEEDYETL